MSTEVRLFALYFTAIWLALFVGKSTCPNGKSPPIPGPALQAILRMVRSPPGEQGSPRDRSPRSPSRFPVDPTRGLGPVSHRPVRRLPGGMIELPAPIAHQPPRHQHQESVGHGGSSPTPSLSPIPGPSRSLQHPESLSPIPGPSGRLSPIPGPSGRLSPIPGPSGPRSPLRFEGIRISPPASPLTLDSVLLGRPLSPPRLSHFPGPSGQSPSSAPEVVLPGPSWSPPPLSPVGGPSGPQWPPSPNSGRSNSPLLRDTLRMLAPRPGEPGSEDNPGTITPGPTQKWLAAAFHGGLIPIERVMLKNEQCSKRSICEEGTCCLDYGRNRKRCKPLGKRGQHCVDWAITTVYFGACPCDPNEGTCQLGVCV
ncbi:uncharacterized protein LOC119168046 isoform X3 [Rhipicephalus microplus]|uniref:uncharacterized protein LOC119168046 isoform X2 n=1 Tax=Rhipicephalus microplus TaxID=6941 RepID=UPI003F6CE1FF